MNDLLFESKPRWPNAPKICLATNRPGFPDEASLALYIAKNCPAVRVVRKGRCGVCGMLHFIGRAPAPSGDSSGSSRR